MTDKNKRLRETFVAVRIGGTWRVMDTRNGEQVTAGPLSEFEAVDLALLLTSMAQDYLPDGYRTH